MKIGIMNAWGSDAEQEVLERFVCASTRLVDV